jgi:AcrR family transcriptional regulator
MSVSKADASTRARSARDRILSAAVRRIAGEGIDDVRIARIAMDAGVSTSLVHYHFATREALLAEALEYSYARAGDVRIAGGELPGASHRERLRSMIDQCLPTTPSLEEDWVLWVELWLRAVRHPELRPVAENLYRRMRDWFGAEIAAGVRDGEFDAREPGEVADRLLALIDGFGIRTLLGDTSVPLPRARTALYDALDRDLGPDRTGRTRADARS